MKSRYHRIISAASSSGQNIGPPYTVCTGCPLNKNDVTTPKFPPPPRTAQNKSEFSFALAVTNRPSASTISTASRLSIVNPCRPVKYPTPPPLVPPAAKPPQHLLPPPKFPRRHHIRHVHAPRNQPRPPLNHRVVHLARRVVTRIPGLDQLPAQTGSKSRNSMIVTHHVPSLSCMRNLQPLCETCYATRAIDVCQPTPLLSSMVSHCLFGSLTSQ